MIKQGQKKHKLSFGFAAAFLMIAGSIIAQPTADGGNSQTICSGASVTLGGAPSASGGTPPYNYSWTPSFGLSSTTVANPSASPSFTTSYTLTVTDAVSAVATSTLTVTVNPSPVVTVNSTSICAGDATTLVASGASAYTWFPGGMTTSTVVVSPSVTTTYTLTGTNGACTGSTTGTVTVNPLPVINAGPDQFVCTNTPLSLNVTGTGVTYYWIFGDGNYSSLASPTHIYSTAGFYYASVRVTSPSGCYSDDTLMITVSDPPAFSVISADVSCNGLCNGNATISGVAGAYPPFTYSWSNGVTTSSTTNLCAGSYLATVSNSAGCASSDTVQITEPAAITPNTTSANITCYGLCNGFAAASPTGGVPPYTYYWSPGSIPTPTATGLCAGVYTVSVTDANGCIKSTTTVITQPSQLVVTTSPNDTICLTTSTNIFGTPSGGTPSYVYSWSNGATTPMVTVNPMVTTTYTLTVTDANGCTAGGNTNVEIAPNTNITGQVTYSGGALSSGVNKAVLFKQQSVLISFDTVQITSLDPSGLYNFSNVDQGDYLVKVFPDTSVYHNMVPTYYGNHYLWDSAATIYHGCSAVSIANIVMIEGGSGSGPGQISGNVAQGVGFGRSPGGPVPGIDIKLGRNPGGLYANTQTDPNGDYSFSGIPVNTPGQKYVVYVDIPGIGRDSSYTFTVSANQNQFNSLDYYVDSALVHPVYNTTVGINHEVVENNRFTVYPNPSKDVATVEYTIVSETKVMISVYNILGVKVMDAVNTKQSAGTYKYTIDTKANNLNTGIYFVKLVIAGKEFTQRLVITE